MKISDKINYLRKKQNLTQQQLCQQLKISRQTLSKWENGTAVPSEENLLKLSQYFNVSLENLKNDEQELQETETVKGNKKRWLIVATLIVIVLGILFCSQKNTESVEVFVHQFDGIGELKSVELDHQDDQFVYLRFNYHLERKPLTIITALRKGEDEIVYEESITTEEVNGCIIAIPKQHLEQGNTLAFYFNWWEGQTHILGMILPSQAGFQTILDFIDNEG